MEKKEKSYTWKDAESEIQWIELNWKTREQKIEMRWVIWWLHFALYVAGCIEFIDPSFYRKYLVFSLHAVSIFSLNDHPIQSKSLRFNSQSFTSTFILAVWRCCCMCLCLCLSIDFVWLDALKVRSFVCTMFRRGEFNSKRFVIFECGSTVQCIRCMHTSTSWHTNWIIVARYDDAEQFTSQIT